MKISLEWLKDYVDLDLPLPRLLEKMAMIGLMVDEWEEKEGDIILDVETYANRPDTLGHLGLARELAAAFHLPLKETAGPIAESDRTTADSVDVQVWDEDLCPRYCGLVVQDVTIGPSPDWLRKRIEAMGLKSINNIVDVTNYVLFATAQPIHAFDLAKISGRKIIIRRAKKGEVLKTLEGKEAVLSPEMLVIADESRPAALAGVIGGEDTAVQANTRDIFIESACFDPISIRMTSKGLGIQTDASYRFERGADIAFPPQAAFLAASLLTQFGGKATKGLLDVYPKPKKQKDVILRHHRVTELLGVEIDEGFIQKTLIDLGFGLKSTQKGVWQVKVPFFRIDVEREADLVEEIARFYGYDRIPSSITPLKALEPAPNKKRERLARLRQVLCHYEFDEVLNQSFVDPERFPVFQDEAEPVEIRNPVSSKASHLRTNLVGGLLENILWNKNRGQERAYIFEIGNIYFWEEKCPMERLSLALATWGPREVLSWQEKQEESDFFFLKGACEAFLSQLRFTPHHTEKCSHPHFEKGNCLAVIYRGATLGHLGLVRRSLLDAYSLAGPVFAAEFDLTKLFEKQPQPFRFESLARYPGIFRDLTFSLDKDIPYQKVQKAIEKLSIPHLEEFDLTDRYSGPPVPEGKVSLSLRFFYRHSQRTLLAEDIEKSEKDLIGHLKSELGIQLREGGKIDKRTGKD